MYDPHDKFRGHFMKSLHHAETSAFFTRDGHLHDEAVAFYVDALKLDQTARLPVAVTGHVETCSVCKEAVFELHEVVREINYEELGAHPFFDKKKSAASNGTPRFLRLAAGLFLGAIAVYALMQLRARNEASSPQAESMPARVDSTSTAARDTLRLPEPPRAPVDLYAANFEVAHDLESLLEGETRSAGLVVRAPQNGSTMREEITFEWQAATIDTLRLQILNNREEVVFEASVSAGPFIFRKKLLPGLYYWKLATVEELLYVGKFLVAGSKP